MAKRDIDAYISAQPEPQRKLLKDMRNIILDIEPDLKQVISYGIPTANTLTLFYSGIGTGATPTSSEI